MFRSAMRQLTRLAVAALVVAAGLAVTEPARAADNGDWAVLPTSDGGVTSRTSFAFDLDPGTSIDDSVTVQNLTTDPITFKIYPADAFNPSTGGISVESPDQPVDDAASWITLATNEVEVPGGYEAKIDFTLKVPSDATPGDHAAGIGALNIAAETQTQDGDAAVQLGVQRAVAVPMFVRVAGPLQPSLAVSDVSVSHENLLLPFGDRRTRLQVTVTNDGNVRLSPEVGATLDALGPGGGDFDSVAIDNLLPGASQTVVLESASSPVLGPATVNVTVVAEGVTVARSESFWAIPWLLLLLVVVAVLVVVFLRRRRRRTAVARAGDIPALVSSGS